MLLPDLDVVTLPMALVVKEHQQYFQTIRANYPGWNGIHLSQLGFVVMTTEDGSPVNGGPLYFWIPTRDHGKVEPGIEFWEAFWAELSGEAAVYEAAHDAKIESYELKSWVATLARGERAIDRPEHHTFADLGLVNDGIRICIAHCSTFDLRTLAAFLTRYAAEMDKGRETL